MSFREIPKARNFSEFKKIRTLLITTKFLSELEQG
jgi:hypothetical protein